ncbi:MAG TPA: ATP-binding protein [Pyrinomonadaceae bacterium]|nr:ATP-binding protein [Pyrinomonadaceae bacterium]
MDQGQSEFLIEIEELVEQIFADLDELRASLTTGPEPRKVRALVDRLFRHVHSVKGSAASSGLGDVSQIAHELENLLDAVRRGQTTLGEAVLDTCESATAALDESLSQAASGNAGPPMGALFDQLRAAAGGTVRQPNTNTEAVLSSIPFEIWQSLTDTEQHRLITVVEEGTPLFQVVTSFDLINFDEEFFRLKERLADLGEVISTSPAVDETNPGKINFRVLYGSKTALATLEGTVVEFPAVTFNAIRGAGLPSIDYRAAPVSSLANFVRTDLDKLNHLISSTHDLFRNTSNALAFALSQDEITADARLHLAGLDRQIKKSFMGVEDGLIKLRTVSLSPTLQRAIRAGRAAARAAGKEVNFEVVGENIELDKLLLESIADPLIHLLRNAVDHGIEDAETRIQSGKHPRGTVRIEALNEGSQSRIRVSDDGRGIDPQLISEAATRLGIFEHDAGLDFDRSVRLIFRPGFTTLESVSDISGRGVGLDVVETAVEQVGGELRVSSKPGLGTTFEIRLPVTFGLVEATVFRSGDNRYCIPASQGDAGQTRDVSGDTQLGETREQGPRKSDQGEPPVVSMRELLGQPSREPTEPESGQAPEILKCQFADERVGADSDARRCIDVLVDKVEGTQEVLVRTLGRHAGRWYGVAGATELSDGRVALVLDLPRLIAGHDEAPQPTAFSE